jgi:dTDP-4-amino-4,6-dideoxygalactose transaminase
MIPFHSRTRVQREAAYVTRSLGEERVRDVGKFTQYCEQILCSRLGVEHAFLTPSCTHALELAALVLDIRPGDEVIVPSFTFSSTINAFVLRGARPRFVDIDPRTMNLDPAAVERALTGRTRAIVAMHYAGIACDMDAIVSLARAHGAAVVEDAAHALFGTYRGRPLGSIGAIGTFSFHRTKNVSCDEGGAFVTNDHSLAERAEIAREKGTDRSRFLKGMAQKYEWIREGSSYTVADIVAAQLAAQLEVADGIQSRRSAVWRRYQDELRDWAGATGVQQPHVPDECLPAWHLYHLVLPSSDLRDQLMDHLRGQGVASAFHYLPLHLSPMGLRLGGRPGDAPVAERVASRLIRLPFFTDLSAEQQDRVISAVRSFRISSLHRETAVAATEAA